MTTPSPTPATPTASAAPSPSPPPTPSAMWMDYGDAALIARDELERPDSGNNPQVPNIIPDHPDNIPHPNPSPEGEGLCHSLHRFRVLYWPRFHH